MDTTHRAPQVPIDQFKRTKIIATIGPATNSYASILALIKVGANGLRLNFSHGTYDERIEQIDWIRKAAKEYGKPVAIIQDLQGPKIRLGDFEGVVPVQKHQILRFALDADYEQSGVLPLQYDLSKKTKKGHRMYLADGRVVTEITAVKDGVIYAEAQNEGILIKRKGINLPDTDFEGDIFTPKDRKDLTWGSERGIDYVAMSFVQTADDVHHLRKLLHGVKSTAKIIAKMETKASVDNMESIVQATDVIMIARGDLAFETEPESVPMVQRQLISLGMRYAKPTIVATQMLASMTESPEPSRAEVSDVATATILGADCLMLSDETATGKYPVQAVEVMKKVITYTQSGDGLANPNQLDTSLAGSICNAVIDLSKSVAAQAIVAETASGATALHIASRRPAVPIIAVTSSAIVAQQLAIVYGTKSYVRPIDKYAATKLTNWLHQAKVLNKGDMVVTASGQHPGVVGTTDTIKVRMIE